MKLLVKKKSKLSKHVAQSNALSKLLSKALLNKAQSVLINTLSFALSFALSYAFVLRFVPLRFVLLFERRTKQSSKQIVPLNKALLNKSSLKVTLKEVMLKKALLKKELLTALLKALRQSAASKRVLASKCGAQSKAQSVALSKLFNKALLSKALLEA